MKNKKGFTLIELLAVIVILAVIMVIAVPQILNVINKSKESAASSSIKLVKDAIKTQVSTAPMSDANFEKTGDCYLFDFENNNTNALNLSLKNKDKIGGSIRYCNGKFESDTLTFDGKGMTNADSKICKRVSRQEDLHTETCSRTDAYGCIGAGYANGDPITYGNLGTKGTLTSGDAFDCDVDGNGIYDEDERFYYVTDLGENSNVAVLIYYIDVYDGEVSRKSTTLYHTNSGQNNKGPIFAMKLLPTNSQWSNVSLISSIRAITNELGGTTTDAGDLPTAFSYDGYAARLLTAQEVNKACNITIGSWTVGELNNCIYLLENTMYSVSHVDRAASSYWLETPYSTGSEFALAVNGIERRVESPNIRSSAGVRPVIEVLKSDIEY